MGQKKKRASNKWSDSPKVGVQNLCVPKGEISHTAPHGCGSCAPVSRFAFACVCRRLSAFVRVCICLLMQPQRLPYATFLQELHCKFFYGFLISIWSLVGVDCCRLTSQKVALPEIHKLCTCKCPGSFFKGEEGCIRAPSGRENPRDFARQTSAFKTCERQCYDKLPHGAASERTS